MMTTGLRLRGTRLGAPRLQVVEARVVAAELELDHSGRAVAVLGDDHLSDARTLLGFIVLRPIKEHYNITVLFNASALSQVTEDRSLIGTLLRSTTQLGDGNNGNAQLTRQTLQRTRYRGHLLHAIVIATRASVHELQVVDEDHVDVVAHPRLPRLQLQRELVHHWSVVDVDLRFTQGSKRVGDPIELRLAQKTAVQALGVDLSLLRQQSLRELFFRHLETEDGDRLFRFERRVQRHIQCQRRVVHQDVLGNEVVRFGNREVIDLMLARGFDGNDLVPVDLVAGELREPAVSKNVGIHGQSALRDATRRVRVESTDARALFPSQYREPADCQTTIRS